jgi:hypothetical protein
LKDQKDYGKTVLQEKFDLNGNGKKLIKVGLSYDQKLHNSSNRSK